MMKLLLVSICLAFALVGGHQHFGCSFNDNLLISNVTSTRGHNHGNPLTDWGSRKAVVPYVFVKGIPEADKAVVRKEMQRITKNVPCITFNEKSQNEVSKRVHHLEIRIGKHGKGCTRWWTRFSGYVQWSSYWYGQKVVLESHFRLADTAECAKRPTITGGVLHELMHALGIAHTQKRSDRDEHITYNKDCVQSSNTAYSQYEKTKPGELKDYGVPYKCNSVMHYEDTTFAKNNQCKTMIPKSASCKATGIGSNVAIKEDWQLLKKAHCGR